MITGKIDTNTFYMKVDTMPVTDLILENIRRFSLADTEEIDRLIDNMKEEIFDGEIFDSNRMIRALSPESSVRKLHIYIYPYAEVLHLRYDDFGYEHLQSISIDHDTLPLFCHIWKDSIMEQFDKEISKLLSKIGRSKIRVVYHFNRKDRFQRNHNLSLTDNDTVYTKLICGG